MTKKNVAAITETNIVLHNALNDLDDRRERMQNAFSTGRHEPSSAFGLYDVEEIDDGGRLIERRERGVRDPFVPVAELTGSLADWIASDDDATEVEIAQPGAMTAGASQDGLPIEQVRYLSPRASRLTVILRRRTILHAL